MSLCSIAPPFQPAQCVGDRQPVGVLHAHLLGSFADSDSEGEYLPASISRKVVYNSDGEEVPPPEPTPEPKEKKPRTLKPKRSGYFSDEEASE